MTPTEFAKERNALTSAIKKKIKPFLWESGYGKSSRLDDKTRLKLWVHRDADGEPTNKSYKLKGGFILNEFEGFSEDGVITDSYAGGLATAYWKGIPIEDLYRLNKWMERNWETLTLVDKALAAKEASARRRPASAAQASAQA